MEKMESPLTSIVPSLWQQGKSGKTLAFGPVAVQLLNCVVAVQERKHAVVDIKSENFMLAPARLGKGQTTVKKLASRIRLLDLALVSPWASVGGMSRTNDKKDGVVGTPLYASINVHNGETVSRRDDVEALGYLISELILKLASGDESKQLPWANESNEESIGAMKEKMVDDITSDFYVAMGSNTVSKTMKEYFDEVRGYTFKKKPDYEHLSDLLCSLRIPMPDSSTARTPAARKSQRTSRTAAAKKSAGTKRSTRSRARQSDSDEEESPAKMAKDDSYMEEDFIDLSFDAVPEAQRESGEFSAHREDADDESDSFATAEMDWEPTGDENKDPSPDAKPVAVKGVTIVVESGPHKGAAVNLVQGRCETIVVGKNPRVGSSEKPLSLSDDDELDNAHITMTLSITRKLIGVVVKDLKSKTGAFIGSEKIRSGGDWKIFRGGTVRIGDTLLRVDTLDVTKVAAPAGASSKTRKRTQSKKEPGSKSTASTKSKTSEAETKEPPRTKRRGVLIAVIEGPHKGEAQELEKGLVESINVGSKPTSSAGGTIKLNKDQDVKATHIRIELFNSSKLKAVVVTDKSKGNTKVNRDTVNKGRAFINDRISIGNTVLEVRSL